MLKAIFLQAAFPTSNRDCIVEEQTALRGLFKVLTVRIPANCGGDYEGALNFLGDELEAILDDVRGTGVLFYLGCSLDMKKLVDDISVTRGFNTTATPLLVSTATQTAVAHHIENLIEKIDKHVREGSGWFCTGVRSVDLFYTR